MNDSNNAVAKSKIIRFQNAATEHRLALAWVISFVAGLLAITSQAEGYTEGLGVVKWPSLIMLLYTIYGLNAKHRNTAKFADSVYFMGFIWTLVALINVVILEKLGKQEVFRAFGYALVTTGLGMSIRIIILQFQRTVSDSMEKVQDDVEGNIAHLISAMEEATTSIEKIPKSLSIAVDDNVDILKNASESMKNNLSVISADIYKPAMQQTQEAISLFVNELLAGSEKIGKSSNEFQESVNRFSIVPEQLDQIADKIVRLESTIENIEKLFKTEGEIRLDAIKRRMEIATSEIARVNKMGNELGSALGEVTDFLRSHISNSNNKS